MATEGRTPRALEAIVLAAGAGARFGGGKLTAPWRGGVLIDGALAAAFAAPARSVTVTVGAHPSVADAALARAATLGQSDRLRLVEVADHAEGMGASLRAAVASLPQDAEGVFVFLGDMPRVPHAVLSALAEAVTDGAAAAAPTWQGARGHPVLFGRPLLRRLLALRGDEGARAVLARLGSALVLVPAADDGVLFDVDSPARGSGGAQAASALG